MIDPPTPEMIAAVNAERIELECAIAHHFLRITGDAAIALTFIDAVRHRIETGDIDPPQQRKAASLRLVSDTCGNPNE